MAIQTRRLQSGVTLVELMVALMLGLLITGGVVQVFSAHRVNYGFNEGLSRLQENGRFALDTLSYHIRLAGYFGCSRDAPIADAAGKTKGFAFDFASGLEGFEAADTGVGARLNAPTEDPASRNTVNDWSPPLPGELLDNAVAGSDVIVVRNGSVSTHALIPPYTTAGSVFAAATEGDYEAGDIVIVADCRRASVFRAAAISEHGGGIRLDRTASRRSRHSPSNLSSEQAFTNGAELLRGEARVYYVGRAPGDGSPALFQQRLVTDSATTTSALAPEELVESVETMQVLYGLDEGLDGAVDQYVTADAVVDWDRIVTVRVALAIRSPDPFGTSVDDRVYDVNGTKFDPADDRRARHVFTTTIALRNRLP